MRNVGVKRRVKLVPTMPAYGSEGTSPRGGGGERKVGNLPPIRAHYPVSARRHES